MTDTQSDAELAALIDERLAAMGLVAPAADPRAATDPNGTPSNVASGALIESAWGNSVTNNIDQLYAGIPGGSGPYAGGWPSGGWPQVGRRSQAGHVTALTSGYGDCAVNFGQAFPNGVISVQVTPVQVLKEVFWWPVLSGVTLTGFSLFAMSVQGYPFAGGHPPNMPNVWTIGGNYVTFDYYAFGV